MARRNHRAQTAFWRSDDLDAELLKGQFADYVYDFHVHETACLALITEGAIHIRMPGHDFIARKGDLYAIDADAPHAGEPVDGSGWSQRTLYIDVEALRRPLGASRGGTSSLKGPVIRDAGLNRLFLDMHRMSEQGLEPLARDQSFLDLSQRLAERHMRDAAPPDEAGRTATGEALAVRRARDYLEATLGEKVSLADLAAASGLPPYRIYRAFERSEGITPHTFQRQARIRHAARLIRLGEPLAEVAAACGFADQAHMTRSFFRQMAVTPGAYQAAVTRQG
jgi:AraC-like DNA-binding protein